jgi:hypothetical protein
MCPPLIAALPYIITAVGTVAGAAISSSSSSSNANKSAAAANAANATTNAQWGSEMKQKNYEFDQTQQQKKIDDFQSNLDRYPSLQKSMISIWGGGQ